MNTYGDPVESDEFEACDCSQCNTHPHVSNAVTVDGPIPLYFVMFGTMGHWDAFELYLDPERTRLISDGCLGDLPAEAVHKIMEAFVDARRARVRRSQNMAQLDRALIDIVRSQA